MSQDPVKITREATEEDTAQREKAMELSSIGDRVYAAEKLVGKRKVKGKTQYLVKWKGFSEADNTWEPEANILDQRLLQAFAREERNKKHRKESPGKKQAKQSAAASAAQQPVVASPAAGSSNSDGKLLSPAISESSIFSSGGSESSSTSIESVENKKPVPETTKSDAQQQQQQQPSATSVAKRKIPADTAANSLHYLGLTPAKSAKTATTSLTVKQASASGSKSNSLTESKTNVSGPTSASDVSHSVEPKTPTPASATCKPTDQTKLIRTNGTSSQKEKDVRGGSITQTVAVSKPVANGHQPSAPAKTDVNKAVVYKSGQPSGVTSSSTSSNSVTSANTTPATVSTPTASVPIHQKTMRRSSPPPELWKRQTKVADQILITDVTSNNMTITVRECKTFHGFFKNHPSAATSIAKKSISVSTEATSQSSSKKTLIT